MKKLQMRKLNLKNKRGVASLYVVIFATILFGVITVSFTRLILSEAIQSSNDDLSQSAYDSAMAGVEDAKVAVNDYYKCVQEKGKSQCDGKNVFSDDVASEDCSKGFPLAKVFYGDGFTGEVKIQESGAQGSETFVDQAYTCVIISDVTPDYRGTLTSDTRTRVIPLIVNGAGSNSADIAKIKKIKFSWYSELNQGSNTAFKYADYESNEADGNGAWVLPNSSNKTTPPTMQVSLISTAKSIGPEDFWNANNTSDVLYSSLLFLPTNDSSRAISPVPKVTILGAGDSTQGYNKDNHKPIGVMCKTGQEFVCNTELEVADGTGSLLKADGNAFLVVNMPYGDAFTDFKIELTAIHADGSEYRVDFKGSQISVDSTGRTNQLYRRVEARLDPADVFFPYPEFELSSKDGGDEAVKKNSWVTSNCWLSRYSEGGWENGTCSNNGNLSNSI